MESHPERRSARGRPQLAHGGDSRHRGCSLILRETWTPSELDHAEAHCLCDRVGAADGLELVEKRGDMKLDGVDGYSEAQRDGFVRRALGQEGQDLYFAR